MFTTFQQTNHQEGKKKNYVSLRVTVKQRDSHRSSTSTLLLLEHQRGRKSTFVSLLLQVVIMMSPAFGCNKKKGGSNSDSRWSLLQLDTLGRHLRLLICSGRVLLLLLMPTLEEKCVWTSDTIFSQDSWGYSEPPVPSETARVLFIHFFFCQVAEKGHFSSQLYQVTQEKESPIRLCHKPSQAVQKKEGSGFDLAFEVRTPLPMTIDDGVSIIPSVTIPFDFHVSNDDDQSFLWPWPFVSLCSHHRPFLGGGCEHKSPRKLRGRNILINGHVPAIDYWCWWVKRRHSCHYIGLDSHFRKTLNITPKKTNR